ncbi:hypothetical protein D9M68_606960 [compost metagenome]
MKPHFAIASSVTPNSLAFFYIETLEVNFGLGDDPVLNCTDMLRTRLTSTVAQRKGEFAPNRPEDIHGNL